MYLVTGIIFWMLQIALLRRSVQDRKYLKYLGHISLGFSIGTMVWLLFSQHFVGAVFWMISPPMAAANSAKILSDYSEPVQVAAILGVAILALVALSAVFRFSLLALTSLTAATIFGAFAGILSTADHHTQQRICAAARMQNVANVQIHSLVGYLTTDARTLYPELRGPLAGGKKGTREYVWDEEISRFKDVGFTNKNLWFKPSKYRVSIDCTPS